MTAGECAFKEKKVKFLQDVLGDEIEEYLKAFENPNAKPNTTDYGEWYPSQMLSFANSQMNRASIKFGPSKLMLLPIHMLRPYECQLDLATQAQFGVKNIGITMATKMEQIMANAFKKAERDAWKLRMKSAQLSMHQEVCDGAKASELVARPKK